MMILNLNKAEIYNNQGMTCDVRSQVAMCGCEPILLKLAMCVHAVHFQACDVRLQLRKFFSNNVSYED